MCPTCDGNFSLMWEPTTIEVATTAGPGVLLQCGVCSQYFDFAPLDRKPPQPLTRDEARSRYPGAVPLSDGPPDDDGPRL